MEAFHFLRPWWLLGIPLLLLLSPWLWRAFKHRSGWSRVLPAHLRGALLEARESNTHAGWFAALACGWLIATLALAGPAWERLPTATVQTERSAIIIMDMSLNTRASDVSPDRLTRLRFKALDLLDELEGTQVGLVAYAGDAYAISPLTHDFSNMRGMIPALSPEIMPVPGNYPLRAFTEAHRMITDAGHERAEIYWFSAGMRLDDYQDIRRFLRGKPHRLSTLLAGDEERSPIRLATGDILRDSLGRLSMAELNAGLFERISREFNGRHARLQADERDIAHIAGQGPWHEQVAESDEQTSDQWRDRGPYLAWLLVPLVLLSVRRGVLLSALLCCSAVLLTTAAPPVHASSTTSVSERALLNQQQRAQRLFERGEYAAAATQFRDPMMRGNAWYRAGDYAAALDAYSEAGDNAERWYNSGNALAQLGELSAAQEAYERALEQRPDWREAQDNKALVEQLQQQQPSDGQNGEGDAGDAEPSTEQEPSAEEEPTDGQESAEAQDSPIEQDQPEQQQDTTQSEQTDSTPETDTGLDDTAVENGADTEQQEQAEQMLGDADNETQDESATTEQIQAALADDELTDEEREALEQLLRRVQNDPATLLRNRMRLEAERRQQTQPPRGVRRP